METLKSIRLQLKMVEDSLRRKEVHDFIDSLMSIHDLVDIAVNAFLGEQFRNVTQQVEKLAELGLVTADLEDQLEHARKDATPGEAVDVLEQVQLDIKEMLDTQNKFLLRTNIFARGKKTLLKFEAGDTLRDVARELRRRYARQIEQHLKSKGADIVVSDAVDILFYGSRVWEDPDDALLSEHTRITDLIKREPKGVLWFPVLPGDSPLIHEYDEDDDGGDLNEILENFTIETDINQLEEDMAKLSERMQLSPTEPHAEPSEETSSEAPAKAASTAVLLRGEGTEREERIPLLGDIVTLGRGRENDIQILNDIKVSRFHCRILREVDTWFIEDNTSSNGTLVDGEPVTRRELHGGENVGIGNTIFRFLKE